MVYVLGLCGEAYEELSPLLLAESIEDIRILCKVDVQGVEVFLLDLLVGLHSRAVV